MRNNSYENFKEYMMASYPSLKQHDGVEYFHENRMKPGVDTLMSWTGRETISSAIFDIIENNIRSHLQEVYTKQFYQFPLICGGTGIGKTRTGVESIAYCIKKLQDDEKYTRNYSHHYHMFIDLSRRDSRHDFLDDWSGIGDADRRFEKLREFGGIPASATASIGMRIAAHYFGKASLDKLMVGMRVSDYSLFTLDNVLTLIGGRYKAMGKQLLMTIQIDEFQNFEDGEMTLAMATLMSTRHDLGVQIIPLLTGTGRAGKLFDQKLQSFVVKEFILEPCTDEESMRMIKSSLKLPLEHQGYEKRILETSIPLCGNIPRFNEYFVRSLDRLFESKLSFNSFNNLMAETQKSMVKFLGIGYESNVWDKLLGRKDGKSGTGISKMCLYSLMQKEMKLYDKLNDNTVEDAKNAGVIYLKRVDPNETGSSRHFRYRITLPLALLDFFNENYHFFDKLILRPYETQNWDTFEQLMMIYRKVLIDIARYTGAVDLSLNELFGGALLGWEDDFNISLNGAKFEIVPTESHLNTSMLKDEYKKATGRGKFLSGVAPILIVISNKSFSSYEEVKEELRKKDATCKFPTKVLVICKENFVQCVAKPFTSWNKLYTVTTSCDCKDCSRGKCPCRKCGQECHIGCGCEGKDCQIISKDDTLSKIPKQGSDDDK